MDDEKQKKLKADWSPIKTYANVRNKPANDGDYIGRGCGNIAWAIIYGLTYIGDCIKAIKKEGEK